MLASSIFSLTPIRRRNATSSSVFSNASIIASSLQRAFSASVSFLRNRSIIFSTTLCLTLLCALPCVRCGYGRPRFNGDGYDCCGYRDRAWQRAGYRQTQVRLYLSPRDGTLQKGRPKRRTDSVAPGRWNASGLWCLEQGERFGFD